MYKRQVYDKEENTKNVDEEKEFSDEKEKENQNDVNKDNKKFTKGIAEINNLIVGAVRKKKKANEYKIYNIGLR